MADTETSMDVQNDLNDLRMSDAAVPLYEHVKTFIRDVVNPMSEEFHRLGEGKTDIWSYAPGQLEALEKAKDEASKPRARSPSRRRHCNAGWRCESVGGGRCNDRS